MKLATFNIQYGFGLDGNCDIGRIASSVADADIIAFQEVTRNFPRNGEIDMPARLSDHLPNHFFAFGAGTECDAGSAFANGRAVMKRMEFGNMVFSKFPILATRNILLPRSRTFDRLNLQRSALEALIATPSGPLRVYSVHLDHRSPDERTTQLNYLMERALGYAREGGAVTAGPEFGFVDLPHTDDFVIMGDFNMMPESPEYRTVVGESDVYYGRTLRANALVDALARLGANTPAAYTWEEPGKPEIRQYLDYCFSSAQFAPRLKAGRIDMDCIASDHKPVWVETT